MRPDRQYLTASGADRYFGKRNGTTALLIASDQISAKKEPGRGVNGWHWVVGIADLVARWGYPAPQNIVRRRVVKAARITNTFQEIHP